MDHVNSPIHAAVPDWHSFRRWLFAIGAALLACASAAAAQSVAPASSETVAQTTCRIVENTAQSVGLPVDVLTRLVWVESRFRADAVSPAGAQGISQFMPQTAAYRGLADPFDPEQAIPAAGNLLVELDRQFGNIGLATAAYNAGPARVANWLHGGGGLPAETQSYVFALTGRTAEEWAAAGRQAERETAAVNTLSCFDVTAALQADEADADPPMAPWGVQLAGNFSKTTALASFERAEQHYPGILGTLHPMVIGTRLLSRGTRPFYRVMMPASSRAQADDICRVIAAAGGACVVLRIGAAPPPDSLR
jgi:hypothetical protein